VQGVATGIKGNPFPHLLWSEPVWGEVENDGVSSAKSVILVNDTLNHAENNVQYVQYGCLVWLGM
jgi:hypothetical protein